jgi:RNA polymerase sigma-70 factor (ECF subfamily)
MHDRADVAPPLPAWSHGLTVEAASTTRSAEELSREFELRLIESSTLAVRIAYSVLRNREDAEDVAQEAFAKAYRSFSQLRDRDRFRAWLVRMTWRMALDRQRSNRRRTAREDSGEPLLAKSAPSAEDAHERSERAAHLWRAIDSLSEKLRIVVILAGIQGHDIKEVSALLDLPEGTVKSRLFAARQQLKDRLSWMAPDKTAR